MRLALALTAILLVAAPAWAGEIDGKTLSEDTRILASDDFEGRSPGAAAEPKTIEYIIKRYKESGLEPAGDNGGWTQTVPMVRTQVLPDPALSAKVGGKARPLEMLKDIYVNTVRPTEAIKVVDLPIVFVGYGVHAPERGWDDWKGVDVKGKIVVFLINDPDFEAQAGDDAAGKFGGKAMTFYGRWVYKYEEAARRGAAGALIVHETPGAGYGWVTVIAPRGSNLDVARADGGAGRVPFQGWLERGVAAELLASGGLDLETLKKQARTAGFNPVELKGVTFSADFKVSVKRVESRNVLGKIPGAKRPNESIAYAAHWDAYGMADQPDAQGRRVKAGALDDAIGVAGLFEIARVLKAGPAPERTVLFAAWTGEEQGLLGSEWFAQHPTVPLETMAGAYTLDVLQPVGLSRDVVLIGAGQNEMEDGLAVAAKAQGRVITPDAKPERGLFYRADHFSLAKRGVPVILIMALGGGPDLVVGGREAGDKWVSDYTATAYHQTGDAWSPDWDLSGAVQDVELVLEAGKVLANSTDWPNWKAGSEFGSVRERSAGSRP
ncbi:M20/M25/M40 family metallo-hydrolase [Caulobacter sp. SLTY]|uniref:M28 family peptidase n=1 Tax=Caulobacter sp. SLTY TaxID=2683262 RepID=UPI0014136072|nr:M28 family peptidase [Caulobacter sp. SLTY]NBB17449.1 M20/M25/M40 family metallo-hydrolase [Caulobacter sp. SLTY]